MRPALILYYSRHGATRSLANKVALGVERSGLPAILRTVPPVSDNLEAVASTVPDNGDPFVQKEDLANCCALAMGSPTRFGNMAAAMKYFWDSTSAEWLSGTLSGKPGCVFTSSSSLHGGQETTLLSMMMPLLHHGMTVMGLPYSEPALHTTRSGGTPYGVTHVSFGDNHAGLSEEESTLAVAQGERLGRIALALENHDAV